VRWRPGRLRPARTNRAPTQHVSKLARRGRRDGNHARLHQPNLSGQRKEVRSGRPMPPAPRSPLRPVPCHRRPRGCVREPRHGDGTRRRGSRRLVNPRARSPAVPTLHTLPLLTDQFSRPVKASGSEPLDVGDDLRRSRCYRRRDPATDARITASRATWPAVPIGLDADPLWGSTAGRRPTPVMDRVCVPVSDRRYLLASYRIAS
jgi:hypothetical protein